MTETEKADFDIKAKNIRRRLERKQMVGYSSKTFFGGILALAGAIILPTYLGMKLAHVHKNNEHEFSSIETSFTPEQMSNFNASLGKFNNSLNFIFGLGNLPEDFDIQNNPYIEFVAYELTEGESAFYRLDQKYELESCGRQFRRRFMSEHTLDWYDQPLCFKNRDDVIIHNNWFMEEYAYPVIAVTYCQNSTENGDWCRSKEQIKTFLEQAPAYFIHQETRVERNIFEDDPIVN